MKFLFRPRVDFVRVMGVARDGEYIFGLFPARRDQKFLADAESPLLDGLGTIFIEGLGRLVVGIHYND